MTSGRNKTLLLVLVLGSAPAAEPGELETVMAQVAAHVRPSVKFVEERHSDLMIRPLVVEGELRFQPPDTLERIVIDPMSEQLRVVGNDLSIDREDREPLSLDLDREPALLGFVEAFRGVLSGDLARLRRYYVVGFDDTGTGWRLSLEPKPDAVIEAVDLIDVEGEGSTIRTIRIAFSNGETTVTHLLPTEGRSQ